MGSRLYIISRFFPFTPFEYGDRVSLRVEDPLVERDRVIVVKQQIKIF